jgi:hypothetical protein
MKAKVTIGIALLLLGVVGSAFAQMTAYANIYAEVVAPVGIEKTADLTFRDVVSSQNSGTVVLGADNFVAVSGADLAQNSNGTLASFKVAGGNFNTFDVSLPKETYAIKDGNANTMIVSNFTSSQSNNNALQGNNSKVNVGATLYIPQNQQSGSYDAQQPFQVTLNYN